ncbi:MAG: GNAT family N-acetyltransferase, partial [Lachnospiraceae bacterium]|nr:GNAT family N-acetyltransferase [Lachnospiraceae bacterium]
IAVSDERLIREETKYRLVSREGEIPFENYIKIDNTNLAPDVVARMIKEHFNLPGKSHAEMMNRMFLEEVREEELEQLLEMQVESFMPLYEKYHDECSPAIESIDKIKARAAVPSRTYYFIVVDGARVGVINIGNNNPNEKEVSFISPIFILPRYQNMGIGYTAIQKAFEMHPEVKTWKLDTILQEKGNCHLYEKCGFVRVGEEKVINDKMTLIDYEYKVK